MIANLVGVVLEHRCKACGPYPCLWFDRAKCCSGPAAKKRMCKKTHTLTCAPKVTDKQGVSKKRKGMMPGGVSATWTACPCGSVPYLHQQFRVVSAELKKAPSPLLCNTCVGQLEVLGNIICSHRGCLCSHATGRRLCGQHKDLEAREGRSLFVKVGSVNKLHKTCDQCRLHHRLIQKKEKVRNEHDLVAYSAEEKMAFSINYPERQLPRLDQHAAAATTYLLDELWPHEWCSVYTLFCDWEKTAGIFPRTVSKWNSRWWKYHAILHKQHNIEARLGTKELIEPAYITQRLLSVLSRLNNKYSPAFQVDDKPTVDEWLCLMERDALQRQKMVSLKTQGHVIYYLMQTRPPYLSKESVCLPYFDLSKHPGRVHLCDVLGAIEVTP